MKKLLIINMILLSIYGIVPKVKKEEIEIPKEEIVESTTNTEHTYTEVTSRSDTTTREEPKVEEVINVRNLELNLETNLTNVSNCTADEFNKMLEGTALYGIGDALVEAEKLNKINGLYLMGLACLESGYGTSKYAKERNNLVGWNAIDSNPNQATFFVSKSECILYTASKLKANYLTGGGKYFEGYTAKDVDKHYCTDKQHANKIIKIVNKLEEKLK